MILLGTHRVVVSKYVLYLVYAKSTALVSYEVLGLKKKNITQLNDIRCNSLEDANKIVFHQKRMTFNCFAKLPFLI